MALTGKSEVYALIGDPVAHSLSPIMQNNAFTCSRIDAVYVPFRVSAENLPAAIGGLRALNVAGFNVTVPHKETIIPLLDQIDPTAALIGAVNTVIHRDGRLIGCNTDAAGLLHALENDLCFVPANRQVLLLGAGGACRAAAVALAQAQVASIMVANRTRQRAEQLVSDLHEKFPQVRMASSDYRQAAFRRYLAQADLIINSTSVGLHGESLNFLPLDNIKGSALIYDMVYSVSETPLIKKARLSGRQAEDGLGMLTAQGEKAFSLWTGVRLEPGFMKRFLLNFIHNAESSEGD